MLLCTQTIAQTTTSNLDKAQPALTLDNDPLIISNNNNNTNTSELVSPVVTEQIHTVIPHIIGDHDVQPQQVLELNNPNVIIVYDDNNFQNNNNNNNVQYDLNQDNSTSFALCGRGVVCGDQLIGGTRTDSQQQQQQLQLPKLDKKAIRAEKNVTRQLKSIDKQLNQARQQFKYDQDLTALKRTVNKITDRAAGMERKIDKLLFIDAERQVALQVDNQDVQEKLQVDRKQAGLEQQKGAAIIRLAEAQKSEFSMGYTAADAKRDVSNINNKIKQIKQEKKLIDAETAERRNSTTVSDVKSKNVAAPAANKEEKQAQLVNEIKERATEETNKVEVAVSRLDLALQATKQELQDGDSLSAKNDAQEIVKSAKVVRGLMIDSKVDADTLADKGSQKGAKLEKEIEKADSKLKAIVDKAKKLEQKAANNETARTGTDKEFEAGAAGLATNPKPLKSNKTLKKETKAQLNYTSGLVQELKDKVNRMKQDAKSGQPVRAAAEADGLSAAFEVAVQAVQKTIDDLNAARDLRSVRETSYEKLMNRALKLQAELDKLIKSVDSVQSKSQAASINAPLSPSKAPVTSTSTSTSKVVEKVKKEVLQAEAKLASDMMVAENKMQKKITKEEQMIERDQQKLLQKQQAIEEKLDLHHHEIKTVVSQLQKKILHAVQNKVDAVGKQQVKTASKEDKHLQVLDERLSELESTIAKLNQRQKQALSISQAHGNSSLAKTILKEEIKAAQKQQQDAVALKKDQKAEQKAEKQEQKLERQLNTTTRATLEDASKLNNIEKALSAASTKLQRDNAKLSEVKAKLNQTLSEREAAKENGDNTTAAALKPEVKKETVMQKELKLYVAADSKQVQQLETEAASLRQKVSLDVSKQQTVERELDASKQITNQLVDRIDDDKKHLDQDKARKQAAQDALKLMSN